MKIVFSRERKKVWLRFRQDATASFRSFSSKDNSRFISIARSPRACSSLHARLTALASRRSSLGEAEGSREKPKETVDKTGTNDDFWYRDFADKSGQAAAGARATHTASRAKRRKPVKVSYHAHGASGSTVPLHSIKRVKSVTLVEVIIVIVIIGALAAGFSLYLRQGIDLWSFLSFRNEVVSQVRLGLIRMGRDIRQIGSLTLDPIEVADSVNLQFFKLEGTGEVRIKLSYANGQIVYERDENPPDGMFDNSNVLMNNVDSSFQFSYFDSNDTQLNEPIPLEEIKRIKITLIVIEGGESFPMQYEIFPRNL